jgi:hypothetical protein
MARVAFTAPCPRCGHTATWHGVETNPGSGTLYEVACRCCAPLPTASPTTHLPSVEPAPPTPRTLLSPAAVAKNVMGLAKWLRGAA